MVKQTNIWSRNYGLTACVIKIYVKQTVDDLITMLVHDIVYDFRIACYVNTVNDTIATTHLSHESGNKNTFDKRATGYLVRICINSRAM